MPHVCGCPHFLPGCHSCQLILAKVNAGHSDVLAFLAANTAAVCAQTAAEAAVVAANAAAHAATAATMSQLDTDLGGNRSRFSLSTTLLTSQKRQTRQRPFWPDASSRKVQWDKTWHGWAQEWHGSRGQDGYIGTVRSRPYKRQSGGSASKNNKQRFQRQAGEHNHGQGMGAYKAKNGQQRRSVRWWYWPQQPKGNHSNQKQLRLQELIKPGVSSATQTVTDQGTQTISPRNSKDAAFSAAEEIMKGYLEPEPELPEIFMLAGNDSEDDEAAFFPGFLPCGPKSRWPKLLDQATTVSSASSADSFSQEDSDEDNMMATEQPVHDTKHDVSPGIVAVKV